MGRVTKKGLEQPVGNAAINKIPRSMILKAVEDVCSEYDYEGGLEIIISVPGGEEAAKKPSTLDLAFRAVSPFWGPPVLWSL